MIKLNIKNMKKYYGSRLLLKIEDLKVYEGEKIGIVGVNGVGKTSLLEIISGNLEYDGGELKVDTSKGLDYISQLGRPKETSIDGKYASVFHVDKLWNENMSGGEKTRFKLAEGFQREKGILLVDEPTSNLDIDGIKLIIENFKAYKGTLLVVSHDRTFLDEVCDKILEIEDGNVSLYSGNYSKYLDLKKEQIDRKAFEYQAYVKEKDRLLNLKRNVDEKSSRVKSTPGRMGNSEARLHKMGGQKNKKKLDNFSKSIDSRLERLEKKDKPKEEELIKVEILDSSKPHGKILISGERINKAYSNNIIFKNASFNIYNGKKVALIGPNGSGKTTLINMILKKDGISVSKNVKIGYFSQSMDILDDSKTILENVMDKSIHDENFARLILARLLIRGDKVYNNLSVLSGGERVKLSFAKMILEDINFLILDEPTNYLDISSLDVIEEILKNYNGSILFVSHDLRFIENIGQELLIVEDKKIKSFNGKYSEYIKSRSSKIPVGKIDSFKEDRMILEMEISSLISRISMEEDLNEIEKLDEIYKEKLEILQTLKNK